jgi:SNF2 family DNA or RNA helicase
VKKDKIVITSYETLRLEIKTFKKINWFYLILDEGHKIKNPSAQITEACKSIHASNRIIITGTPLQNSLTELWSLIDFVSPGLLSDQITFEREFCPKILKSGYLKASKEEVFISRG